MLKIILLCILIINIGIIYLIDNRKGSIMNRVDSRKDFTPWANQEDKQVLRTVVAGLGLATFGALKFATNFKENRFSAVAYGAVTLAGIGLQFFGLLGIETPSRQSRVN